jgi:hypothetical protein
VIMIDCSGSMAQPGTKMSEAIRATAAAIDTLPNGTEFAVVAGRANALMAYPDDQRLVVSSKKTRAEAKAAVRRLTASGGTAMGTVAGPGPRSVRRQHGRGEARHPAHRRPQPARDRRAAGRDPAGVRGAGSCATVGGSARVGARRSSARSRPLCSARPTVCPTRQSWSTTFGR